MRPQHITAENAGSAPEVTGSSDGASMRPQHITAENVIAGHTVATAMALQ